MSCSVKKKERQVNLIPISKPSHSSVFDGNTPFERKFDLAFHTFLSNRSRVCDIWGRKDNLDVVFGNLDKIFFEEDKFESLSGIFPDILSKLSTCSVNLKNLIKLCTNF